MDGWIIALLAGGVALVGLAVLLGVVVKSAATTAQTAQAVLDALEDIKASTAPLAQLGRFDPETMGPAVTPVDGPGDGRPRPGNGTAAGQDEVAAEEQRGKEG